ncbi:MAG: hypothetical protein M9895_03745 [Aquamicrobium sp.]|uniref:SH3 domain-containing protein n=1 Tax=Aquamicrobium sp. TaxID=1872579 RepID=UPI00349EE284|nr:hypothetical protein [Aquamicrobium sp.]
MPALAAPLVLSVCGGVALVLAFGTLFGLQPRGLPTMMTSSDIDVTSAAAEPQAEPEPAIAAAPEPEGGPAEEPALVTALPDAPTNDAGEAVLEPIAPQPETAALADVVPDPGPTAAIPPALPAEITAFAPQPRPANPAEQPARNDAPAAPARAQPEPARAGGSAMRAATVRQAVNLRAAPNKRGQVVMVVPASAQIEAEANCGWCEISYQGRTGFIYKSFINYR